MTVQELIAILEQVDPNTIVCARDYECGVGEIDTVIATEVKKSAIPKYSGEYAVKGESAFEKSSDQAQRAIFIGHTNALGDGLMEVEGDELT
jgi:hypothetical protein